MLGSNNAAPAFPISNRSAGRPFKTMAENADGREHQAVTPPASGEVEHHETKNDKSLWARVDANTWLVTVVAIGSLLVGIGSLFVSWFTYVAASDTSDIKHAVVNLATLAGETRRQADIAHDNLVANHRAWISVTLPGHVSSLVWDKAGGGFHLRAPLIVENQGNSPALDLEVHLAVTGGEGVRLITDAPKQTRNACHPVLGSGFILFPGGPSTVPGSGGVSKDEVAKLSLSTSRSVLETNKPLDVILINVIACATYKIAGDPSFHTTGIRYAVNFVASGLLTPGKNEQLYLLGDIIGNYAD